MGMTITDIYSTHACVPFFKLKYHLLLAPKLIRVSKDTIQGSPIQDKKLRVEFLISKHWGGSSIVEYKNTGSKFKT